MDATDHRFSLACLRIAAACGVIWLAAPLAAQPDRSAAPGGVAVQPDRAARPERAAQPSAAALAEARQSVESILADALVAAKGGDPAAGLLVAKAGASDAEPATAFVLYGHALDAAVRAGSLPVVQRVLREFAGRFAVDEFALLERALSALREREDGKGVPTVADRALTFAYLDLAALAIHDPDEARGAARRRAAVAAAVAAARAGGDDALAAWARDIEPEFAVRAAAWRRLVAAPAGAAQPGRYFCFFAGDWERGLPLLAAADGIERNILRDKGGEDRDYATCLSIAESWRARGKASHGDSVVETALVQRNLEAHALAWYYRAWPSSAGVERTRLTGQMRDLEDRLCAAAGPGRIRFAANGVGQMIVHGGRSTVENGRLVLKNLGPPMSATCRYAFTAIRSVTIRGGILSEPNLNFRFAVDPFNALCNWEVQPENHFFVADRRSTSQPPLLQRGREHEFRLRQLGDEVVLFVDGAVAFRGEGRLRGSVSVYPSLKSEIFVREILIDGDVDPHTPVTGPLRKLW